MQDRQSNLPNHFMGLRDYADVLELGQGVVLADEDLFGAGGFTAAVWGHGLDDEECFRCGVRHEVDCLAEFFFRGFLAHDQLYIQVFRFGHFDEALMRFPLRFADDTRQLDVHADDVDCIEDTCKLLWQGAVRFEEHRHRYFFCQFADECGMQQWFSARKAHGLMRDFLAQAVDFDGHLLHRARIGQLREFAAARIGLDLTLRMAARRIFRIAVAAVEVAALKPHKYLTAADVFALALDGRENFNQILFHGSVLRIGDAGFR